MHGVSRWCCGMVVGATKSESSERARAKRVRPRSRPTLMAEPNLAQPGRGGRQAEQQLVRGVPPCREGRSSGSTHVRRSRVWTRWALGNGRAIRALSMIADKLFQRAPNARSARSSYRKSKTRLTSYPMP